MKTKSIVASSVVLSVLLFLTIPLIVFRKPPDITVRHVKSGQSGDITTMTFEIKNHTAAPYLFCPYGVQVRNGNAWTNFQDVDYHQEFGPPIGPTGLVYCTVDVRNLPAKSVMRFSIGSWKTLLGLSGLFKRAAFNLTNRSRYTPSLNPFDTNTSVFGKPTEITSDEFVEQYGLPK